MVDTNTPENREKCSAWFRDNGFFVPVFCVIITEDECSGDGPIDNCFYDVTGPGNYDDGFTCAQCGCVVDSIGKRLKEIRGSYK